MQNKSTYYIGLNLKYNPSITKKQSNIKFDNLYFDSEINGYEFEQHITLFYGVFDEFSDNESLSLHDFYSIVSQLDLEGPDKIKVSKISKFSNPKYDVIKFEVDDQTINNTNKIIREKLSEYDIKPTFDEYKSHLTLAYVKPNSSDEILGESESIELIPDSLTITVKLNNSENVISKLSIKSNLL